MRVLIAILILLITFSSCKMGKNFEKAEIKSDSTFRFSNDSLIAVTSADSLATLDSNGLRWWELFKDPILDTLVNIALENNREVQTAIKNIEQAELAYNIQKAEILPEFDVKGNINRGNYSGFLTDGANTSWYGAGSVTWEIDFWGKYRRLNESAKADYLGTKYAFQSIQLTLISQVTTTYFELQGNKANYEIAKQTLDTRDSSLLIIQERFDQGIIPEIDLNQAQIQKAIAASAVPVYERRIALTENRLGLLLGTTSKKIENLPGSGEMAKIPEIPTGLPSQLLNRRPDILLAEQNIVSQNALVGAAQAARFPSISLTGLLGIASNELTGLTAGGLAWNAGANLAAPLFHFGKNKRRVEVERVKTEKAVLAYEQTVLIAFKDVEDALIKIETYKKELIAREYHVKAALNAQNLSKLRYDKGVTSYLEYLEQQRQAFEAQLQQINTRQNLNNSYVALYKALGGGWPKP
ncbi:MAG: transporter [Crocinitomicaceae bacterium]|nr:transporter [Crocinitomicaceae bacterium]|tara:strand:+ start:1764 stop:3167 length:1404 start_codon:yes stop_codon:yes gene_type:complete